MTHHFFDRARDWNVWAMIQDGLTQAQIAERIGLPLHTARLHALRLGWTKAGRKFPPKADPRITEIISLRESGATLQDIGTHFGISRERVRQILKRFGRDDLRNVGCYATAAKRRSDRSRVLWRCIDCGKEESRTKIPARAQRCQACSRKRGGHHDCVWFGRIPEIIELRGRGLTWAEVNAHFGFGSASSQPAWLAVHRYGTPEQQAAAGFRRAANSP